MKPGSCCRVVALAYALFVAPLALAFPTEYYVRHGDYLSMTLSPDGGHLAALARFENKVVLLVLDANTLEVVGGIQPQDDDVLHTATWVTNERLVFELAIKVQGFDQPVPTGELFAINRDGSGHKHLYGFRGGKLRGGSRFHGRENTYASQTLLSTLPGEAGHILILETPWFRHDAKPPIISRLNINTGRKQEVERLPHPGTVPLATRDGEVKFITWVDADNTVRSSYRDTPEGEWLPIDAVFESDTELTPLYFSRDERFVFLIGPAGPARVESLFRLELATGIIEQLGSGHATDVQGTIADASTGEPAVMLTYPGRSAYEYPLSGSETAALHRKLAKSFSSQTVNIPDISEDARLHLVHVTSDINPGEYYLYDAESNEARFLWANNSWIDREKMRPKRPISVPTSDGLMLHGYLTLPDSAETAPPPPLVVLSHGGPHGVRDTWTYDPEVQLLSDRGIAVLQVNFRGSGGYGRDFLEAGYLHWGDLIMRDILEAVDWVIGQGFADGERMCTYGTSFGGYAALMLNVVAPDRFRCAVGASGVYDLNLLYESGDVIDLWFGEAFLEDILGTDRAQLKQFSPSEHAGRIKARVMLAHGAKDERAPEEHAERMRDALKDADNKPLYYRYRDAGHGIWDEASRLAYYQALEEFLVANLMETPD